MKSVMRTALLAGLTVLALSGIATASASAAACKVEPGSNKYQLCVNGTANEIGTPIEGHSVTPLLVNLENWQKTLNVECSTSALVSSSFSQLSTSFQGCHLLGKDEIAKRCMVHSETEFQQMSEEFNSAEEITVGNGYRFTSGTWLLENAPGYECPREEKTHSIVLSGTYKCKLLEAKVEAVEHELTCTNKSNTVYFDYFTSVVVPLSYKQKISLAGANKGKKFSIYEAS